MYNDVAEIEEVPGNTRKSQEESPGSQSKNQKESCGSPIVLGVLGAFAELPGGAIWVREVVREGCYQGSWLINPGLARSVGHIYVDLLLNI